ncbi:MAG TPA: D-alanyl-D-alanine carboxypeptidase, partial [Actinomycetota bacterium]|nr:D-alanyl-D-alanine carboxypeptidase [Actinomycetota bacterium]
AWVAVVAVALWHPEPVARAAEGAATLGAAPARVVAGEPVVLSGAVDGGPSCTAGREVALEALPSGAGSWSTVAVGETGPAGEFSFTATPAVSTRYRATVPAVPSGDGSCPALSSPEVAVEVAALVELQAPATVRAGACPRVAVTVSPPKPGSPVELERRRGDRWVELGTGTLDEGSSAAFHPCFGFDDLGAVPLRASWAGDPANAPGSAGTTLEVVRAAWMVRVDGVIGGRAVSVAVADDGVFLYRHQDGAPRTPASNEKLLLSMAILDALGPDHRLTTEAAARRVEGGVVRGDLWILGGGDPELGRARLALLAERIRDAGIHRVTGSVEGSTGPFGRDWWAPGWRWYFPREEVPLPTALVFAGNVAGGVHVADPERRAAAFLTRRLERLGVRVGGPPGMGRPPAGLTTVAQVSSRSLRAIVSRMNRTSDNLAAEVLGKLLGATELGPPGTIAKGAEAIGDWAAARGVRVRAFDASGLSYRDRLRAVGLVRLLDAAEEEPWGAALRRGLAAPGQGTLEHRLAGVEVRAKTGTLSGVSALSGWVWLERGGDWAAFSILSEGLPKATAVRIEDAIVRAAAAGAR